MSLFCLNWWPSACQNAATAARVFLGIGGAPNIRPESLTCDILSDQTPHIKGEKWVGSVSTPQDENSSHPIRLSLAGCSPAEPVSVSPDVNIITHTSFFVKFKFVSLTEKEQK